jgi:hypothetical protein
VGVIRKGGAVNSGSKAHRLVAENTADLIAMQIVLAGELHKLRKQTTSTARTMVGGWDLKKKKRKVSILSYFPTRYSDLKCSAPVDDVVLLSLSTGCLASFSEECQACWEGARPRLPYDLTRSCPNSSPF